MSAKEDVRNTLLQDQRIVEKKTSDVETEFFSKVSAREIIYVCMYV